MGPSKARKEEAKMTSYLTEVKEDPLNGDLYIEFPPEFLEQLGWGENDELIWEKTESGSWSIRKNEDASIMDQAKQTSG
jgi:hypothetical protein